MRQEDPMLLLFDAMSRGSSSGVIEASEKRGQDALVSGASRGDCQLPTDMRDGARASLEAAGVKFLGQADGDPMFQCCTLPAGWKIRATTHQMHSDLRDDKGRKRASIFYKAAFYDRSAHLSMDRRYRIRSYYNDDHETIAVSRVEDQETVLFESERLPILTDADRHGVMDRETWEYTTPSKRSIADKQCRDWLAANFPNWDDVNAYWD